VKKFKNAKKSRKNKQKMPYNVVMQERKGIKVGVNYGKIMKKSTILILLNQEP
jgi:hypothetical protein